MAEERLQRALARAGVGSRRASEDLIREGRVTVNGRVASIGDKVDVSTDRVAVDGVGVSLDPDLRYFAFHKPAGVTSTVADPHADVDLTGFFPPGPRVFAVGRLDRDTEGLLLFTNDGELAHRLAHPSYEVPKTYLAQVSGSVKRDLARRLQEGVDLEDGPVKVDSFKVVDTHAGQSVVEVVLHEGRKHIVRRLLAHVGLPVSRLTRTAIGPVRLNRMREGSIRKLTRQELGALKESVGL